MTTKPEPLTLEQELAKLEEDCRKVTLAISNARTIRETVEAAEIEVPHHLLAIARSKVPSLGRLARVDRKSTRLNSSHIQKSRMPSSA